MPRIYISHRPEDSSRNEVTIIRERLVAEFGAENVLQSTGSNMEVTTNLQRLVWSCDVLLIVIGRYWSNMVDERGNLLLEDPYDPIHVEIDAGLKSVMVSVILMVDDTPIPRKNQLPEVLQPVLKKVTLEAPDHDHLERVLDELIGLWSEIPDKSLEDDDPIEATIIEESEPEPQVSVLPERAQAVLAANPPYQPPTQRRSPRNSSGRTSQQDHRSWLSRDRLAYLPILFVLGLTLGSILLNNNGSEDNSPSGRADGAADTWIQVEPTTDPALDELQNNVRGTAQAALDANCQTSTLDVRNQSDGLP